MKTKVGINGFGRIGRNVLKAALNKGNQYEVVAINDLTTPQVLAHLFKYDSCFGIFDGDLEAKEDAIVVNGKEIKIFAERDPAKISWKEAGVQLVLESTGLFASKETSSKHIDAGAKKVIISAPASGEDITVVMGVNEDQYDPATHHIISNASCTTNCLGPVAKVVDQSFGLEQGMMTTIHSYTNDQKILDLPHKDLRRSRAAAVSMIPTTTGAAKAVGKVLPHLNGKLNGMAIRVPTPAVSLVDVVFELKKKVTADEVNVVLKKAAETNLKGILGYCDEPLVSIDFKEDPRSSIVDALSTMVLGDEGQGKTVKVLSWYDNEWGYSNRVADLIGYVVSKGL